jgi:hypothetical protein
MRRLATENQHGPPQPVKSRHELQTRADTEMRDHGIIVHRRGKKVVGLTIQNASAR